MYAAVVRKAGPAEGHRGGRKGAFLPVQESQFHLLEPLRVLWLTGCAQRRVLRSLSQRPRRSTEPPAGCQALRGTGWSTTNTEKAVIQAVRAGRARRRAAADPRTAPGAPRRHQPR